MNFNSWSMVIGLIIIIALSTAAWFLSPKGDNQTLFRSTLILTFISCYLMWVAPPHCTKAVRHSTRSCTALEAYPFLVSHVFVDSVNWLFARLSVVRIVSSYPVRG
ncbi:ATPase V0 complex subunit E [Penicillium freii]|nr:ATPase V0 complex subunit E [Penicillium freii]